MADGDAERNNPDFHLGGVESPAWAREPIGDTGVSLDFFTPKGFIEAGVRVAKKHWNYAKEPVEQPVEPVLEIRLVHFIMLVLVVGMLYLLWKFM